MVKNRVQNLSHLQKIVKEYKTLKEKINTNKQRVYEIEKKYNIKYLKLCYDEYNFLIKNDKNNPRVKELKPFNNKYRRYIDYEKNFKATRKEMTELKHRNRTNIAFIRNITSIDNNNNR